VEGRIALDEAPVSRLSFLTDLRKSNVFLAEWNILFGRPVRWAWEEFFKKAKTTKATSQFGLSTDTFVSWVLGGLFGCLRNDLEVLSTSLARLKTRNSRSLRSMFFRNGAGLWREDGEERKR
jgi:hypothetical protein